MLQVLVMVMVGVAGGQYMYFLHWMQWFTAL
jgi:hypothetical protein